MNHLKFFDGTYCDDAGEMIFEVYTLRNPYGFTIRSSKKGKSLSITVDDMLDLAERIGLCEEEGLQHITADCHFRRWCAVRLINKYAKG